MGTGNPPGRPRKPAAVRLFEDNPGKRRINPEYEPAKLGRDSDPPAWLKGEGRREWFRLLAEFAPGQVATIDRTALAAYCSLFGNYTECEWMLRRNGLAGTTGEPSPWIGMREKFRAQMRVYEIDFGMTPLARTRLANVSANPLTPQSTDSPNAKKSGTKQATQTPAAGNLAGLIGKLPN